MVNEEEIKNSDLSSELSDTSETSIYSDIETDIIYQGITFSPEKLNTSSAVNIEDVILPKNFKSDVFEFIDRSFHEFVLDYVCAPKFAVVSLSGGLDSSTALIATSQAIGIENTRAVFLRHKYMTRGEKEDEKSAEYLCEEISVPLKKYDITQLVESYWRLIPSEFNPFVRNVLKAEGIARARAGTVTTFASCNLGLVIDTSNFTEIAMGNFTVGDISGMVGFLDELLKCEVYAFAEQLGVPKKIIEQKKRISEFDCTHEMMFGADCRYLDPIIYRIMKNESIDEITKRLGHDYDWVQNIFTRVMNTKFRLGGSEPSSSLKYFIDDKRCTASWVLDVRSIWRWTKETEFGKALSYCRERYMP